MKYHTVTLGCQMNKSDSERVSTVIEGMGFVWTDVEEEADLLGIIACSVRQKAIDKVYNKIHKWNLWKNKRNLLTFVTGCVLPSDREKFLKQFDMIFQVSDLMELPEMIKMYGIVTPYSLKASDNQEDEGEMRLMVHKQSNKKTIIGSPVSMKLPEKRITGFWHVEPHYQSSFEAFIPIQNGCDKFCTFCAVPYTRGREISRPSDEILDELKKLVRNGYKSITLLGQNVNSYGKDKEGIELSFSGLLHKIGEFGDSCGKDFWVYFTSPHPRDMQDDVLIEIARYKCLAKQIHLPLQSGDDAVLIRMNRNHKMSDYRNIINSIRTILPDATLFTDIIVGFTGETDEQFRNTCSVMEEIKFNMAYIARYSPRPGAASSRWKDDVSFETKKQRLHELSVLLQAHSLYRNTDMLNNTFRVLVTSHDRKAGFLSGITEGKIIVRFASSDQSIVGRFVDVKINSVADFSVEGEIIYIYKEETVSA